MHAFAVEHGGRQYVWDGQRWYDAADYTHPPTALLTALERLVPEKTRKTLLTGLHTGDKVPRMNPQAVSRSAIAAAVTYPELIAAFGVNPVSYHALLALPEWHERRNQILARDEFKCRYCGRSRSAFDPDCVLEVHHQHYIINRLPWDYPDELLITLCKPCHTKLHEQHRVFYYEDVGGRLVRRRLFLCPRCSGNGYFPQWEHIEDGICFRCRGARVEKIEEIQSPWFRE